MNRIFKKFVAVTITAAMTIASVPLASFAACTTHIPNKDSQGNVIYYVEKDRHYNICADCYNMYNSSAHVDDGSGYCGDCSAALDSAAEHTHSYGAVTYIHMDPFGHVIECDDCYGVFETHTNMTVGDNNGDGTWDCDYCGWDGVIIGKGCVHDFGNNPYFTTQTQHYRECNVCHNNVYGDHEDYDNDQLCDDCDVKVSLSNAHTHEMDNQWTQDNLYHYHLCKVSGCNYKFDYEMHGDDPANPDGICDKCGYGTPLNGPCQHVPIQHNGSFDYAVFEDEHFNICSQCFDPFNGQQHADYDHDDLCDVCGVEVDSNNKHNHDVDSDWNQGSFSHCHPCKDAACNYSEDDEPHDDLIDNNDPNNGTPDGFCDKCGYSLGGNQGGGNSCTHAGNNLWYFTGDEEHELYCGDCGESVSPLDKHDDADYDGNCDVCGVGVVNNIHTHVWAQSWSDTGMTSHFHDCTDSACTTSTDSFAHVDDDNDGACDDCGVTNKHEWCPQHIHNGDYNIMGDKHYTMCASCCNAYGDGENHMCTENYVCDWWGHHPCCEVCGVDFGEGEEHSDNDANGFCDICQFDLICRHNNNTWFSTTEEEHEYRCGDCGERISPAELHDDADHDDNCDVCGVSVVNNIHNHVWSTVWTGISDTCHYRDCTDAACSGNCDFLAHVDDDNDDACDECGAENKQDWCPKHIHNGDYYATTNMHYMMCAYCNNAFGTGESHIASSWAFCVSVDKHQYRCEICWGDTGAEYAHADTDLDGICDECYVSVNENAKHQHSFAGWSVEERVHFHYCYDCGLRAGQENHADSDNDGRCDVCDVQVNEDVQHICTESEPEYLNNMEHRTYCHGCMNEFSVERHSDADEDGKCDVCHSGFDNFSIGISSASKNDLLSALENAVEHALNGDMSDMLKLFSEDTTQKFMNMLEIFRNQHQSVDLDIMNSMEVVTEKDLAVAPDLEYIFDRANAAIGSNKLSNLFAFDAAAVIRHSEGVEMFAFDHLNEIQQCEFAAEIPGDKVKDNRVWHLYVSEDDGETFTKVKSTEKGAASFTIDLSSSYNIYALAFEDLADDVIGDMNSDGEVNSADVNLLYRVVMDYAELTDEQTSAADVNGDGSINSADGNLLFRYVMGYVQNLTA